MSSSNDVGGAFAQAILAALQQPEPSDWTAAYTPEEVDELSAELADLEHELDEGWPGWRENEPFAHLPEEKAWFVKVRLKRRRHIVFGDADHGIARTRAPSGAPVAMSVLPGGEQHNPAAYAPVFSVLSMARALGVAPDTVRAVLPRVPTGTRGMYRAVRRLIIDERLGDPAPAPTLRRRGAAGPGTAAHPAPPPSSPSEVPSA